MTETPAVFRDMRTLREAFVAGLERMLREHQDLGVFILVLANASYDADIHARLAAPLRERFDQLATAMREQLRAGRPLQGAADDILVFLKLMVVGFDDLESTRFRNEGPYQLQFNPLRAYRPPRMSDVAVSQLHAPFNPDGFHFNKPFLRKEVLWSGELLGSDCHLFYNKFPFAQLHGLLVIEPEDNKPQWLSHADHDKVWQIAGLLGSSLPGVGFGYNAYGAFASVNHLHLQMHVRSEGTYPVEAPTWQHNGGEQVYPVECHVHREVQQAWQHIQQLHDQGRSYNLLYRPGCLYLLPRAFQGSYRHAGWTSGFAWAEVVGAITTFNAADFDALDAATITAELAKLRG